MNGTNAWVRAALMGLVLLVSLAGLVGCDSKAGRVTAFYTQASVSRPAAAAAMAKAWQEQKILLSDCLDLAFDHVEKDGDAKATAFAGAVLDFAQIVEADLPKSGEMELFWMRLGGLAAVAAEKAAERPDFEEARSLVLAGPTRWQTEAYWRRHPNHDALAAYILYRTGAGAEAVRRLRSRADLDPVQEQALRDIEAGMRDGGN